MARVSIEAIAARVGAMSSAELTRLMAKFGYSGVAALKLKHGDAAFRFGYMLATSKAPNILQEIMDHITKQETDIPSAVSQAQAAADAGLTPEEAQVADACGVSYHDFAAANVAPAAEPAATRATARAIGPAIPLTKATARAGLTAEEAAVADACGISHQDFAELKNG